MSTLTDFFTSLANKVRSKLGTETTYTPAEAVSAIDDVYDAGEAAGIAETKVGNAAAGDVLSGKTFTNSSTVGETGSMTNNGAVSQSLNCGGSYTVPAGYHNGSGTVTANSLASQTGVDSGKTAVTAGTMVSGYQGWVNGSKITGTFAGQEKTVTAGTSAASVTPDSGKYLTKVTYNPTPSQSKSASSSTSAQTITPDSGKLLSSVSISAISPQRSAEVAATTSGLLNSSALTGFVYFPYGWYPNYNTTYGCYCSITQAQAQAAHYHTGTVTVSTRGASVDIGQTHSYRYVNTNGVPNSNSGTYTFASGDTGATKDLGATNTYRYVNAGNVYTKGIADGCNNVKAWPKGIFKAMSISKNSGDWVEFGGRRFTRSSSRTALVIAATTYSGGTWWWGYCLVSMYSDAFSGTANSYGGLDSAISRTANGITYYHAIMTYKLSDAPSGMIFYNNGTTGSPVAYDQKYNTSDFFGGMDVYVKDILSKLG